MKEKELIEELIKVLDELVYQTHFGKWYTGIVGDWDVTELVGNAMRMIEEWESTKDD